MNSANKNSIVNRSSQLDYFIKFLVVIFYLFAIRYQIYTFEYIEFGDETETIVAAKMIAAGNLLYSQIFNHHGPLLFLPGALLESFGTFGIKGHRALITVLQLWVLASIYYSPLLTETITRILYTFAAASITLLYFPDIYGHMYIYQVLSGLMLVVIFSKYTLPAIVCPDRLSFRWIFIGNVLLASLPFLAITYLPISILIFFASLKKNALKQSIFGLACGYLANILFLATIGSIPGYVAFHIYLNAKILSLYDKSDFPSLLLNTIYSVTGNLNSFILLLLLTVTATYLTRFEKYTAWRSLLIIFGITSLLIRGTAVHEISHYYSLLTLPLVFFINYRVSNKAKIVISLLILASTAKASMFFPWDKQKIISRKIVESTDFSKLTKLLTNENDRVVSYSFNSLQYIISGRLPASGNYFYFPWQEEYNKNPKFGITIDSCNDIKKNRPKVMYIDKYDKWSPSRPTPWGGASYGQCVQKIMDEDYYKIPDVAIYVRKDILTNDSGIKIGGVLKPTSALSKDLPIVINLAENHIQDAIEMVEIGLRFGTNAQANAGDAELQLTDKNGYIVKKRFLLNELFDNQYHFFKIDSNIYTSGQLLSISGGGVALWESFNEKSHPLTCILYKYADGRRRFTPGCPLF